MSSSDKPPTDRLEAVPARSAASREGVTGILRISRVFALAWLVGAGSSANPEFLLIDPHSEIYYQISVAAGSEIVIERDSEIDGWIHSNGDVRLRADSLVTGDVSATGEVVNQGVVVGSVTEGAFPLALPLLPGEAQMRALASRVFEKNTVFVNEVIDDVVFVAGKVDVEGSLSGQGTILATREIRLRQDLSDPGESRISLVSLEDIRLDSGRQLRGAMRAGRDVTLEKGVVFDGVIVADHSVRVRKDSLITFLNFDSQPPQLTLITPTDGEFVSTSTPEIAFTFVDDQSGVSVESVELLLDGADRTGEADVTAAGLTFVPPLALTEGSHSVDLTVVDHAGNEAQLSVEFTIDTLAPQLATTQPADGSVLNASEVVVVVEYSDITSGVDLASLAVTMDGDDLSAQCGAGQFQAQCGPIQVMPGPHLVEALIRDLAGNQAAASASFEVALGPPEIAIAAPDDGLITGDASLSVEGILNGAVASVTVNGVEATLSDTSFTAALSLAEGTNRLVATAYADGGRSASDSISVRLDTDPPLVVIETPRDGDRLVNATVTVAGTVNDIIPGATVNDDDVTVTVNGLPAAVLNRSFITPDLPLALGANTLTAVAIDRVGNTGSATIEVAREPELPGIRLEIVGGNNQLGPIRGSLPEPLEVRVLSPDGELLAGRPVTFEVSRGDGLLGDPTAGDRSFVLLSDGSGLAAADFHLGTRTGEGFHRVRVTTPGSVSFVELCSTAIPGAPVTVSITRAPVGSGIADQELSDRLSVIVTDDGGNPVPGVPVTFQVELGGGAFEGAESLEIVSDADGIAEADWALGAEPGTANNEASATFEGNPGLPAYFVASAFVPGPPEATRISGVVQDSTGGPIVGARAVVHGTGLEAFTGADGAFTVTGVPPGGHRVAILGSTADDPAAGIYFPDIEYAVEAISGADNRLDQLVVLPFLDLAGAKLVGGDQDVVLEMDGVTGFGIRILAHSVILPDGSRGEIMMSSSQVKFDKVPMPPPQGAVPVIVGTLQPGGIHFDPPAQVIYPNVEGLAPGDVADIFAFHHDIGQFVNIGPGTVSEDGAVVASDPGFGIVQSGWHCLVRFRGAAGGCANDCSGRLEWRLVAPDGRRGPARSSEPVELFQGGQAEVKVRFAPGGGTFDSSSWSGGPPEVTLTTESASGATALAVAEGASIGMTTLTTPTYRVPVPNRPDETCAAEVDVEVEPLTVEFDTDPLVVGFTKLPLPPLKADLWATVMPKEATDAITFSIDNPARATISVVSRDIASGRVLIEVTGLTATPASEPGGDAEVQAKLDGDVVASAAVIVVVPTTQSHSVGTATITNSAQVMTTSTWIQSEVGAIVTFTVLDQFGQPLNSVYDGVGVVTEEASQRTGFFDNFPTGEQTIVYPNADFTGGLKEDYSAVGNREPIALVLTPQQVSAWGAGTQFINGANNIFRYVGVSIEGSIVFKIRVHGHVITPDFRRTVLVTPDNHPPIPLTIAETPIP